MSKITWESALEDVFITSVELENVEKAYEDRQTEFRQTVTDKDSFKNYVPNIRNITEVGSYRDYNFDTFRIKFRPDEVLDTRTFEKLESSAFESFMARVDANSVADLKKKIDDFTDEWTSVSNGLKKIIETYSDVKELEGKVKALSDKRTSLNVNAKSLYCDLYYPNGLESSRPFYLENAKGEIVGLVKVIKKEDSGLGYTVEDTESGKKTYHVPQYRLKKDYRDYDSKSDELYKKYYCKD